MAKQKMNNHGNENHFNKSAFKPTFNFSHLKKTIKERNLVRKKIFSIYIYISCARMLRCHRNWNLDYNRYQLSSGKKNRNSNWSKTF